MDKYFVRFSDGREFDVYTETSTSQAIRDAIEASEFKGIVQIVPEYGADIMVAPELITVSIKKDGNKGGKKSSMPRKRSVPQRGPRRRLSRSTERSLDEAANTKSQLTIKEK